MGTARFRGGDRAPVHWQAARALWTGEVVVRWKSVASGAVRAMLRGVESLIAGESNTLSRFRGRAERQGSNYFTINRLRRPTPPRSFPNLLVLSL